MGAGHRHLEVQIRSRATGKVVMGVVPTIGLHDKTAMSDMAMTVKVPAVAMEGIGEGAAGSPLREQREADRRPRLRGRGHGEERSGDVHVPRIARLPSTTLRRKRED